VLLSRGRVETLNVPHTSRGVQSRRDLLVGTIQSAGVVLLHHPGRGHARYRSRPHRGGHGSVDFGRKVVIPAGTIERIDVDDKTVFVDLTKDQIKDSPEYDPTRFDEDYLMRLGTYYDPYL
jgi:hypothetical protein